MRKKVRRLSEKRKSLVLLLPCKAAGNLMCSTASEIARVNRHRKRLGRDPVDEWLPCRRCDRVTRLYG